MPSVGEVIRGRIAELGISQTELAARVGEHFQTISAIINGKREATISLSVRIDEALDLPRRWISPLVQSQWHRLDIWFRKKSVKNKRRA